MGCSYSKGDEDTSCSAVTGNVTTNLIEQDIDVSQFNILPDALGIGGFGIVRKVKKIQGEHKGSIFAMKTMSKSAILKRTSGPSCVMTELKALTMLENCTFVCSLHYAFQDSGHLYMIMDIADGGDMRYNLKSMPFTRFQENVAKNFIAQVFLALNYCHRKFILHRDVKPENILMSKTGFLKLTDFGVAKILPDIEDCRSTSGTHGYMAPEIYMDEHIHGTPAEWFATGVTLHEFLTGRRPFEVHVLQSYKGSNKPREPLSLDYLDSCTFLSAQCKDFIRRLLTVKSKLRLGSLKGFNEIANHPWMSDIDWCGVNERRLPASYLPDTSHARTEINSEEMKRLIQQSILAFPLTELEQQVFKGYEYRNKITDLDTGLMSSTVKTKPSDIIADISACSNLKRTKGMLSSENLKHKVTSEADDDKDVNENVANCSTPDEDIHSSLLSCAAVEMLRQVSPPRKRRNIH